MLWLAVSWCGRAAAEVQVAGQPLDLRVARGATCLDQELLADELSVWLKDTALPAGVIVEVVGSEHDPHTLTTRVHAPDGSVSERVFSPAPSFCPYLHQAVALTLSLALKALDTTLALKALDPTLALKALDPTLALKALDPSPAAALPEGAEGPLAAPPPEPGPPPTLPAEPTALRPSSASAQLALSAGGVLSAGAFGHLALGGSLGAGLVLRRATVGGDVLLLRSTRSALAPSDATYQIGFLGGRVGACVLLWTAGERVGIEACVEGLVGRAEVATRGGQVRGNSHVLWGVQPLLALRVPMAEQRAFVRLGVGLVSVYRPLRIAARDESGTLVGGQSFARVAGVFTLSVGYGGGSAR